VCHYEQSEATVKQEESEMGRKYLSIDTEATGLEEDTLLIQFAVVPVDVEKRQVLTSLGKEVLIHCPSFEELKPRLNPWVTQHNEGLIREAHAHGIPPDQFPAWLSAYLKSPEVQSFLGGQRAILLGKSLSALDLPLLKRYLGADYMRDHFHHHTLDVTCIARYLVDSGALPEGCESTSQIVKYFKIREEAAHTALNDAIDMAQIYLKLISWMTESMAKARVN
jgi:hypothetical protein